MVSPTKINDMIQAVFYERNNYDAIKYMPFDVHVKQYSWNCFGGPEEMTCNIDFGGGSDSMLWSMVSYLRCPVLVLDHVARPVWWGYVHTVNITNGVRSYGISIDTMFNRSKATYELLTAGSSTGLRFDTIWQQDDASIAEFGAREKVYPLVTISDAAATADVATRLDKSKYPTTIADLQMRQDQGKTVEMICKGWWYTLDWLYYENLGTAYETISNLLDTMLDDGDFIVDIYSQMTSTVLAPEYRKGDDTLRNEIEMLMNIGTDNSKRILATTTKDRYVILTEEPDPISGAYYLDKFNQLYDPSGSVEIDPTVCKVGVWATLKDFQGITYTARTMIPPSPVFIERATYDCVTGIYQPEQRGYKSPYEEIQDIAR